VLLDNGEKQKRLLLLLAAYCCCTASFFVYTCNFCWCRRAGVDRLGQYLFVDRSSCYLFSD
jgi:hypothetical protein